MKYFRLACAVAVLQLFAAPALATVWTNNISYDGIIDVVQDNSVSFALLDSSPGGGADGKVSVGDIIVGTVKWNINITDGNPVEDHAITIFAAAVTADNGRGTSVIGGNSTINFSLGAAPGVLDVLLPTHSAAIGGFSANALGMTFSRDGGPDPTTQNFAAATALIDTTYTRDFEFGFGVATDYFEAELRDHRTDGPPGAWTGGAGGLAVGIFGDGVIDIRDTDGDGYVNEYDDSAGVGPGAIMTPGLATTGAESGGFSVLRDFSGPGPSNYLPVTTISLAGMIGSAQISLSPSTTLIQPTQSQVNNGYVFADQSTIALNAVPEPGTMLLWSGLLCTGAVGAWRRKKQKAA